jgi:DNA-binding response OmpR family regulator
LTAREDDHMKHSLLHSAPPLESALRSRVNPWTWQRDREAALVAPPRALVAEDDPDMRALVVRALRLDGYDVVEARSGPELALLVCSDVLESPDASPVDLIVSDVVMPGCTGLDVLGMLRARDWAVPVLLITAFGSAELHADARRLGASILDKPFELGELRRVVKTMLG